MSVKFIDATIEKTLDLRELHQNTWRGFPDDYWFKRLIEEVGELGASLANDHADCPDWELMQIAAIALNWIDKRHVERTNDPLLNHP